MISNTKPIRLIEVDELVINNNVTYQFRLNKDAFKIFQSHKNNPIAPISIAGQYRSGKSFLANRILNQMNGFQIGSSTNACTKGVWIWPLPIKKKITIDGIEKDLYMYILDCEGSNSTERSMELDSKLTSQILLISSAIIYNTFGAIEESHIDLLGSLQKITTNVVKANKSEGMNLKADFPKFFWVLRDFGLDLKYDTPNAYLEKCLIEKSGEENVSKNNARISIKENLKKRFCFTLPRPISEESQLNQIQSLELTDQRRDFCLDFESLQSKLFGEVQPKYWDGRELDSMSFLELIEEICVSLNKEDAPVLKGLSDRMFDFKISQIVKQVTDDFQLRFIDKIEEQLPMDTESMFTDFFRESNETLKQFVLQCRGLLTVDSLASHYYLLNRDMQSRIEYVEKENEVLSQEKANKHLKNFSENYRIPALLNKESFTTELFNGIKSDYAIFLKNYQMNCKGPMAKERAQDHLVDHIFVQLSALYQTMNKSYENYIENLNVQVSESHKNEKRQRVMINEQDDLIKQYQEEKVFQKLELQNIQIEVDTVTKRKENEKNIYEEKIRNLEDKLENKRLLYLEAQAKIKSLEDTVYDKSKFLSQKEEELDNLYRTIEEKEKLINECELRLSHKGSSGNDNESFEIQKNQTRELEKLQQQTRQLHQAKMKKLVERVQAKELEKAEMMTMFEDRMKKIRDDYKIAVDGMRNNHSKTVEELKLKISDHQTVIKSLKTENFKILEKKGEMIKMKYVEDDLRSRIITLEDSQKINEEKYQQTQASLNKFIHDIEMANRHIQDVEEERNSLKISLSMTDNELQDIVNLLVYLSTKKAQENQIIHLLKKIRPPNRKILEPVFEKLKLRMKLLEKL